VTPVQRQTYISEPSLVMLDAVDLNVNENDCQSAF
jgi:hypothetical protein